MLKDIVAAIKEIVDAIKCLTRPTLALGLFGVWAWFISVGIDVPTAFEGVAVGVIAEWALERGYRWYKER